MNPNAFFDVDNIQHYASNFVIFSRSEDFNGSRELSIMNLSLGIANPFAAITKNFKLTKGGTVQFFYNYQYKMGTGKVLAVVGNNANSLSVCYFTGILTTSPNLYNFVESVRCFGGPMFTTANDIQLTLSDTNFVWIMNKSTMSFYRWNFIENFFTGPVDTKADLITEVAA